MYCVPFLPLLTFITATHMSKIQINHIECVHVAAIITFLPVHYKMFSRVNVSDCISHGNLNHCFKQGLYKIDLMNLMCNLIKPWGTCNNVQHWTNGWMDGWFTSRRREVRYSRFIIYQILSHSCYPSISYIWKFCLRSSLLYIIQHTAWHSGEWTDNGFMFFFSEWQSDITLHYICIPYVSVHP